MLINAYDTHVGKPFAVLDHVNTTLQRLALMNDLERLDEGVYAITHENGQGLPFLNFPLSAVGYDRKPIVVVDNRPYTDKRGNLVNRSEQVALLTAAYVQKDVMEKDYSVILRSNGLVMRALARAWGQQLIRSAGLTEEQSLTIYIIIAHYYNCLINHPSDDVVFSSQNLIQQNLGLPRELSLEVIEKIGYLNNIKELHGALVNYPGMYKLKTMQVKDLVALGQRIWYSSTGKQLIGAALEHPPLLIGMCAATISNKTSYGKTPLGLQLDPKYNEKNNRAFILTLANSYAVTY